MKMFQDFEYCHDKIFNIKSAILVEADAKELKALYIRLNNFIVSESLCGLSCFANT
jgi:hypothetical protein